MEWEALLEAVFYLSQAREMGMASVLLPLERDFWSQRDFEPCWDHVEGQRLLEERGDGYQLARLRPLEKAFQEAVLTGRFEGVVRVDGLKGSINEKKVPGLGGHGVPGSGAVRRKNMNASNLEALKGEMEKLGFSPQMTADMEVMMAMNLPRFILYGEVATDRGPAELALHFNQSRSSEFYYLNKFDLVLEKQPKLEEGERYMVVSQRQGEDAQLRAYMMPSLAVKEFNTKMALANDIKGTASILVGREVEMARVLASMEDGKLVEFEKDFYRTLKNPAPAQTFYLEKGNGFSLSQAANLLCGRSVYREDILNVSKNEYAAWTKLDFDAERERGGNFHMKNFTEAYGFDLPAVLDRFDFVELGDPGARVLLEAALRNGDRAEVGVMVDGKPQQLLVEAVPEFKQLNLYSMEGKSIKREGHLKAEVSAGMDKNLGKAAGKKKDQEQGLSV